MAAAGSHLQWEFLKAMVVGKCVADDVEGGVDAMVGPEQVVDTWTGRKLLVVVSWKG